MAGVLGPPAPQRQQQYGVLGNPEDYRQSVRPFAPGEFRPNADGSYSTELLTTVQLPDGRWVNVPSLWMANNQPVEIPSDDLNSMIAQRYENATGTVFPRYPTLGLAESAAVRRSAAGGASDIPLAMPMPRRNPSR